MKLEAAAEEKARSHVEIKAEGKRNGKKGVIKKVNEFVTDRNKVF